MLESGKRDPHPFHRPLAPAQEHVLYMISEVLGDEVIHERVDAAVETGQAQGGDVEQVHCLCLTAQKQAVMHQQQDVAGSEAHNKHNQHNNDQHHGLSPLLRNGWICHAVPERLDYEGVGYNAHNSRNNESHSSRGQEVACCNLLLTEHGDVVAGEDLGVIQLDLLVIQVEGGGEKPHHHPDGDRDAHGCSAAASVPAERVDDGPVTLDTDAGDEGDGAVHVGIKKRNQNFT